VTIDVRVIARARKTEYGGERDGAFLIRLAAPPVDGAANDALVEFLSDSLKIPRGSIRIVSGERGRRKRVAIEGITMEAVARRLSDPQHR
jgi:uncharacterized protein (TIGR00251 family)